MSRVYNDDARKDPAKRQAVINDLNAILGYLKAAVDPLQTAKVALRNATALQSNTGTAYESASLPSLIERIERDIAFLTPILDDPEGRGATYIGNVTAARHGHYEADR